MTASTEGLPAEPAGRRLPGDRATARARLPERTVSFWRVQALALGIPVVGLAVWGALSLDWFTPLVRWIVVAVLAGYFLIFSALIAPPIRWRIFWYAVSADEIDLQHGLIVTTRVVIPMNRVQHLKLDHGPIADRFHLASLHIHTAAGEISLHGLDFDEAERVRERIGELAGLAGLADDV